VTGLYVAYWLDLPPGPPVAVLGAAVYAVLALGAAARGPGPLPCAEEAQ
jgi:ABC-type Mn2+/Zn2+ transport system permease subunit